MPKNLIKVHIFEPSKPNDSTISKSHFNGKFRSSPTSYSFHFDTKLMGGSFYIDWEQIPQFIMDKTLVYREKSRNKTLNAPSVQELKQKIDDLFKAYMRELSEIKYEKKIGIRFYNSLCKMSASKEELSISIKYIVFYSKTYFNEDGTIQEVLDVSSIEKHDTKIDTNDYDVYSYSDELEESVIGLQQKLHTGMKEFIGSMATEKDIISHFQSHNLLETKTNKK